MPQASQNGLHYLDDKEQRRLAKIVADRGLAGAARLLDLSRGVVSAAAGGFGVRRGSIELVRDALARLKESGEQ